MGSYPAINDREYDLLKRIASNTGVIADSGGGGGGSSYSQSANFAALPPAALFSGTTYLVLASQGVYFVNRKPAGLYRSDGANWIYMADATEAYFSDSAAWGNITSKPSTFPPVIGGGAGDAVAGNDSRLTNERVPTAAGLTTKFGTNKASIADGDKVAVLDSAASDAPVHILWSLVKSTLKTYFDGIYTTAAAAIAAVKAGFVLDENASIDLDAALSSDGKYCGICEAGTAGTALAFGDLCYFAVADSRWELTDADAAATAGPVKLGICVLAAASDGDPTVMLLWGKVRADSAFPTLTVGAPVYVGLTEGDIAATETWGTDDVIRVIGHANTADELFFHPSNDFITYV